MGDSWINCGQCGHRFGSWISTCPQCGAPNKKYGRRWGRVQKVGAGLGISTAAFLVLIIVASFTAPSQAPQTNQVTPSAIDLSVPVMPEQSQTVSQQQPSETPRKERISNSFFDLTFELVNATQKERIIRVDMAVTNHGNGVEYINADDLRLMDGQKQLYKQLGLFHLDHEIAPSATSQFQWTFRVPEGTKMADCQVVIIKDADNLKYMKLDRY